jgi:hypothetical protein
LSEWIKKKKKKTNSIFLQETFKYKDNYGLKVNEWRIHSIPYILNSDRVDFKVKKVIRDKEGYNTASDKEVEFP